MCLRFGQLPGERDGGGDFVMIATEVEEHMLKEYLRSKDMHVVYKYNDLVYDNTALQPEP